MPKSKHRKNQKKKAKARTQRIKDQQNRFNKMLMEEFLKAQQEMIEEAKTENEKSTEEEGGE
jgi:hypothetical protein